MPEKKHIRQNYRQWKIERTESGRASHLIADLGGVRDLVISPPNHEFTFCFFWFLVRFAGVGVVWVSSTTLNGL